MARTLIIFDVDGTLTESMDVDTACYVAALDRALGLRPHSSDWSAFTDCSDAGIAAELFTAAHDRDIRDEELAAFHTCFLDLLRGALAAEPCADVPGAGELLRRLRARADVGMCIATGGWESSARLKLASAGVDVAGLAFASCNDARNRRDIVRAAMERALSLEGGQGFDACVSVGDGAWDVATAAELGMPFVGIGRGERATRLRHAGARIVLDDFTDVDAFMSAVTCAANASGGEITT